MDDPAVVYERFFIQLIAENIILTELPLIVWGYSDVIDFWVDVVLEPIFFLAKYAEPKDNAPQGDGCI